MQALRESLEHVLNADLASEPKPKAWLYLAVRWLYFVIRNFITDQCILRASALSYTTVLSIVPFLAVIFAVSKGFNLQNTEFMRELLGRLTLGRVDAVNEIINYINNTGVKTLGIAGITITFGAVLSLLGTIEATFNSIWGVQSQRTPWRKFSDYMAVMVLSPVLMFIAISFNASFQHSEMLQQLLVHDVVNQVYVLLISLIPFIVTWLALFFLYVFMPNTGVNIFAALGGSFLAGAVWQTTQWLYLEYQIGVANYNAIYGGFAQVPLFLAWLYISWAIVLLGAEVSFALQNMGSLRRDSGFADYSFDERQKLAALLLCMLTEVFEHGGKRPSNRDIAEHLGAPVKLINEVLFVLAGEGIVVKVDQPEEETYSLAQPPDKIRILDVTIALAKHKENLTGESLHRSTALVDPIYDRLLSAAAESSENVSLRDFSSMCSQDGLVARMNDEDFNDAESRKSIVATLP